MLYDLHSHSSASDGTLTPRALVERATAAGVNVLALTDHDDTSGVPEALAAADGKLALVPGVELSVSWGAQAIHVLGLQIDHSNPVLQGGLAGLRRFRDWRAEEIGRRLAKHGVRDAFQGARALAKGAAVSRTHFAQYLVSQGFGKDVRGVFRHFLRRNKPGYVPGQWASLEEAVGWIKGSGGLAAIAHPARYDLSATKRRRLLGEFIECGGVALEVISGSHTSDDNRAMAAEARRLGLAAAVGSDFHGPESPWIELGRLPALPADLTPIWELASWPRSSLPRAAGPSSPVSA